MSMSQPRRTEINPDPSSVTALASGVQGAHLRKKKKNKKNEYYYGDYYFLNKNFLWEWRKTRGNFPSAKVAFIKPLSRYHKTSINWNPTKLNAFFLPHSTSKNKRSQTQENKTPSGTYPEIDFQYYIWDLLRMSLDHVHFLPFLCSAFLVIVL